VLAYTRRNELPARYDGFAVAAVDVSSGGEVVRVTLAARAQPGLGAGVRVTATAEARAALS
jgi:hypothetical protein